VNSKKYHSQAIKHEQYLLLKLWHNHNKPAHEEIG